MIKEPKWRLRTREIQRAERERKDALQLRIGFRRVAAIHRRDGLCTSYDAVVACVADLTGEPYDRVFEACLDEDI